MSLSSNAFGLVASARRVTCSVALILLPIYVAGASEFEPEYENAELHGPGNVTYDRVRVTRHWRAFHDFSGGRLAVENDTVLVLTPEDGEEPRRIPSPDGRLLRRLGAADGIAFFVSENSEADVHAGRHYVLAEIQRLSLDSLE